MKQVMQIFLEGESPTLMENFIFYAVKVNNKEIRIT